MIKNITPPNLTYFVILAFNLYRVRTLIYIFIVIKNNMKFAFVTIFNCTIY